MQSKIDETVSLDTSYKIGGKSEAEIIGVCLDLLVKWNIALLHRAAIRITDVYIERLLFLIFSSLCGSVSELNNCFHLRIICLMTIHLDALLNVCMLDIFSPHPLGCTDQNCL